MTGSEGPVGSGRQGRASQPLPAQGREVKPETSRRTKREQGHDDSFPPGKPDFDFTTAAAVSNRSFFSLRTIIGATVALYILNQSHCLPKPLSAVVSKCLFWPSLPITVSRRIGRWTTQVDETVLLGGAPFGFLNFPEHLYRDYGVRSIPCDKSFCLKIVSLERLIK